jgi:hypothetical protein
MSGAFASAALQLWALGLAPIPCQGDDGKVPRLKTAKWKRPPGEAALRQLVLRFPEENVGLLTGLSRITVVDIDEARLLAEMLRRFGKTPLMVETPSGSFHLYYRAGGERCTNLRSSEGLPVDIKGVGGFTVCPPSIRPSGPHKGQPYRIVQGAWEDVHQLPTIRPGSLTTARQQPPPKPMPDGTRGNGLFRHALVEARVCDSLDALVDRLCWINETACEPPVEDARVVKTAESAWWRYQQAGRNFAGKGGRRQVFNYVDEIEALQQVPNGADASFLLVTLRATHYGTGRSFAVSPRAMARSGIIRGWTEERYRAARTVLVDLGSLIEVKAGGRGPGKPSLFGFSNTD